MMERWGCCEAAPSGGSRDDSPSSALELELFLLPKEEWREEGLELTLSNKSYMPDAAEEVRKVVLPAAQLDNAAHLAVCMVAVQQEVLRAQRLMEYSSGPRHIRSHHAHTRSCSGRNPVCSKIQ